MIYQTPRDHLPHQQATAGASNQAGTRDSDRESVEEGQWSLIYIHLCFLHSTSLLVCRLQMKFTKGMFPHRVAASLGVATLAGTHMMHSTHAANNNVLQLHKPRVLSTSLATSLLRSHSTLCHLPTSLTYQSQQSGKKKHPNSIVTYS